MFTKHDSRNFFPWHHGIITNLVMYHQCMKEVWVATGTYSAGAGIDVASMDNCYATPIHNLGKWSLTDEYFRAFATLILWKEIQLFGFPWCSTREDLSIDVSITNVGLILTKLRWFLLSGYGRKLFQNRHMKACRHTKNFMSKLKIMHPRMTGLKKRGGGRTGHSRGFHNTWCGCRPLQWPQQRK